MSSQTLLNQASQCWSLHPRSDPLNPPWGGRGQPAQALELVPSRSRDSPGGGPPASQGFGSTHFLTHLHIKKWTPLLQLASSSLTPQAVGFATHHCAYRSRQLPAFKVASARPECDTVELCTPCLPQEGTYSPAGEGLCMPWWPTNTQVRARRQWHSVVGSSGKRNRSVGEGIGAAFSLPCIILCWHRGSHSAESPAPDSFKSIQSVTAGIKPVFLRLVLRRGAAALSPSRFQNTWIQCICIVYG